MQQAVESKRNGFIHRRVGTASEYKFCFSLRDTEYFLLLFILAVFHLVFDVVVEQIIKLKMKQGTNTRQGFTIYARVMCERFYVNKH